MGPFLIIFAVAMIGLMSGVSGGSYAAFVIFVGIALSALSGDITWLFVLIVPAILAANMMDDKK